MKSRRDIVRSPTHVSLESFFQREMRKEESVPHRPRRTNSWATCQSSSTPLFQYATYAPMSTISRAFAAESFVSWRRQSPESGWALRRG